MDQALEYKHEVEIDASIEKVWDALINPEMTQQYMYGCEAISDWKVGSKLTWRGVADGIDYVVGFVVKFEPNRVLAFSVFDPNGEYEDIPDNYLTSEYVLSEENGKTKIKITQGDYSKAADGQKRFEDADGWVTTMEALKNLLES